MKRSRFLHYTDGRGAFLGLVFGSWVLFAWGEEEIRAKVLEAMRRATDFFCREVAVEGSYLWRYSVDLAQRWGENEATLTQGWVQPPGTPAVGDVYLLAYEATQEESYLDAARKTAHALVATQLVSGGWDYRIEFDPDQRKGWAYRVDVGEDPQERRNTSVYDDNNTQSALLFLMHYDRVVEGKDSLVREAIRYGLDALLKAQFPNGAFPQVFDGEIRTKTENSRQKAHYPETWSRQWTKPDYKTFYTFNDHVMRDILRVLLMAHRQYGDPRYLESAKNLGDFMLLAQMPSPQPAWAQQYNSRMEPDWARRFEPPAIASSESVGVIQALVELYRSTGERKYLEATVPAVEWLERSRIGEGKWARFYELQTNRPLYVTRDYTLTYTDDDLPTHYSFQGSYGAEKVMALVRRVVSGTEESPSLRQPENVRRRALEALHALDEQGRWIDNNQIRSSDFIRHMRALIEYVELFH